MVSRYPCFSAFAFQAQKVHYGLVAVSDGKCRPQTSRLKLTPDFLVLQVGGKILLLLLLVWTTESGSLGKVRPLR
jgi:hypothetical protein